MQNNRKLYELVATLSKSEKIYLKKFVFVHDKKKVNVYLELFDLLQKKNIDSDEQLLNALKKSPITRNLPSIKHYLYKYILRTLRNYYQDENANMEVKNLLAEIHILLQKGLYSQCRSLITSTKKITLKYDMHIDYLNLLKIEARILILTNAERMDVNIIYDEQREVTKLINKSIDYNELSNNTWHLLFGKGEDSFNSPKIAKELFHNPILTDIKYAHTFYDKSNFYFTSSRKGILNRDEKETQENLISNIKMWESHPHFIHEHMSDYLVLLHTLICSHNEFTNHSKNNFIQDNINKLKSLSSSSLHIQSKIFQFAYMSQQNLNINLGLFEVEKKVIPEVERGLMKFDTMINYDIKLVFYVNTAYICFGCEDYKAALMWINKGLSIGSKADISKLEPIMKVINLFINIELENFELLEFSLRSVKRKLKKSGPQSLNLLLEFVKAYPSANSDKQKMKQLLISTIQKLRLIMTETREKQVMDTFDFISHLESKLNGQSFAKVFKQKLYKIS